jgi:HPt (histidine-containing phosphotransfer) domain-containing protein
LIEDFYKQAGRLIGESRKALEEGRMADLRRSAHTLKSNSATFGVGALEKTAMKLEDLARDGILAGTGELVSQCEAEFPFARAALEKAARML